MPSVESHESTVHGFPSLRGGGVPGKHVPVPSQISSPLQMLPSLQDAPAVEGTWVTPVDGSQLSTVHGLPSSSFGGVRPPHVADAVQVPEPRHGFVAVHAVPTGTGVCVIPVAGEHESAVHGL
jgi:hypothetical protein